MRLFNTNKTYGFLTVVNHWLSAFLVLFLFVSGLYMTGLGYYDTGYYSWPLWHKQLGVCLALLFAFRLVMKVFQVKPLPLVNHQAWELRLASFVHGMILLLILLMLISGYLIATSKGEELEVFGWFQIPALWQVEENADWLGKLHLYSAYLLIATVVLHVMGALKHLIIDRDATVARILGVEYGDNQN